MLLAVDLAVGKDELVCHFWKQHDIAIISRGRAHTKQLHITDIDIESRAYCADLQSQQGSDSTKSTYFLFLVDYKRSKKRGRPRNIVICQLVGCAPDFVSMLTW